MMAVASPPLHARAFTMPQCRMLCSVEPHNSSVHADAHYCPDVLDALYEEVRMLGHAGAMLDAKFVRGRE